MTAAAPLLWWSGRDLEQLAHVLDASWMAWLSGWRAAAMDVSVRCLLAHDAANPRSWGFLGAAGASSAWWDGVPAVNSMKTALFGPERHVAATSIAAALEQRSRLALQKRLVEALELLPAACDGPAQATQFEPWSGSVVVHLASSSCSTWLLLNGACVNALIGSPATQDDQPAASHVEDGLSALPIRASVEVSGCELTLGDLQAIRCGDILRLPHSLEDPLSVTVETRPVCAAFLGARNGLRAVELAPG